MSIHLERPQPNHRPSEAVLAALAPEHSDDAGQDRHLDPVLDRLSEHGRATYRLMEADPVIASAKRRRIDAILDAGSRVEIGRNQTLEARELRAWVEHALDEIPDGSKVPRLAMEAIFHGWQTLELQWAVTAWRGRDRLAVHRVDQRHQPGHDDRHRTWMVCDAGASIFQAIWPLWWTKQQRPRSVAGRFGDIGHPAERIVEEIRPGLVYPPVGPGVVPAIERTLDLLRALEIAEPAYPPSLLDELMRFAILGESADVGGQERHRRSDRRQLERWINRQLIQPLVERNFGRVDRGDLPRWRVQSPEY